MYPFEPVWKDFAFLRLKENQKLYVEAHRKAADYYQESLSAKNLLLVYHHLREAGDHTLSLVLFLLPYFHIF